MEKYKHILDYLYTQLPVFQRVGNSAYKEDLSNTLTMMQDLGNPEKAFKSIHIAGTNGKGSISILLSQILIQNGYKTGLYTSPHYRDFRERIRINGRKIPKSEVEEFVQSYAPKWQKMGASFFELTVAMAFNFFREAQVDIAVIEVGMGGRLDSTNVILPELSIITRVGLDHQKFLGDTIEKIAREKAGIIKPGVPVILGKNSLPVQGVIVETAEKKGSEIEIIDSISEVDLNIPSYQKENLATVMAAVKRLKNMGWNLDENKTNMAISNVFNNGLLPGRWQTLGESPLVIADSAHNFDGIQQVMNEVEKSVYENLHIVFGTVQDKDPAPLFERLPKHAIYYFCMADIPRALPTENLMGFAKNFGLVGKPYKSVKQALRTAKNNAGTNDLILITGSIFVVAEVI